MQIQPKSGLTFKCEVLRTTRADDVHDGLHVFPKWRGRVGRLSFSIHPNVTVPSWIAHESAEQVHDLDVVLLRMLVGKPFECVDATQSDRANVAAEHFGALLIAFVK